MVLLIPDKHESFLQDDTIIFDFCNLACQSIQNNKFAISSQYLKENRKNKADFLLEDKHQRFLQINTIILGLRGQACPNYPK